jgi:hypothetical protein
MKLRNQTLTSAPALSLVAVLMLIVLGTGQATAAAAVATTLYIDRAQFELHQHRRGQSGDAVLQDLRRGEVRDGGVGGTRCLGDYVEHVVPANCGTASAPIAYQPAPKASVTISGGIHDATRRWRMPASNSTRWPPTCLGFRAGPWWPAL